MKSKTYGEFVEKFKPKKTTDDCYTPPVVYDALADYVAKRYNLDRSTFCRPFYPGGDYEHFDYDNKIVVDNPPFSIFSKILQFYTDHNIKFFLFAPHLTVLGSLRNRPGTIIATDIDIIYENGARVNTDFITNLEPCDIYIKSDPELFAVLFEAVDQVKQTKTVPKYKYPANVVTICDFLDLSRYGVQLEIPRSEACIIGKLDSQKEVNKGIFGSGLLVSDRIAKEKIKARAQSQARAQVQAQAQAQAPADYIWALSDREREIINKLNTCKGGV